MQRTLLRFESIQQIQGSDQLSVILLTDEPRRRALSVVCDMDMARQIVMRLQAGKTCVAHCCLKCCCSFTAPLSR